MRGSLESQGGTLYSGVPCYDWLEQHPMRDSPPLAPEDLQTVYLVLDDLGEIGLAYRETSPEAADLETVLRLMMTGEFNKPVKVIAFNLEAGWARDVSEAVARRMQRYADHESQPLSDSAIAFIDRHLRPSPQAVLPFPVRVYR